MNKLISLNEDKLSKIKSALEEAKNKIAQTALAKAEAALAKAEAEAALAKAEAALAKAKAEAAQAALEDVDEALKCVLSATEKETANTQVKYIKQKLTKAVITAELAQAEVVCALAKIKIDAENDDEDNIKCVTDKTNLGYYLLMTARIASLAGLAIAAISELLVGLKIIAITFIGLSCSVSTSITGGLGLLAVCVPHVAAVLLAVACIAAICYLAYTVCSAKQTSCLIQGDVETPIPGC